MKTKSHSHGKTGSLQRPTAGFLAVLLLASTLASRIPAHAQSMAPPDKAAKTSAKAPISGKERSVAPAATSTTKASTLSPDTPSRFVSPDNLAPYIKSKLEAFTARQRTTDPFGQPQDPDAKPVVKPSTRKSSHRPTQIKATPFSDIVKLIKVTTIMPAEKRFLIGTRSIREGQRFPINFRSKNINVEVVSVSSRKILLRDTDSNDTATIDTKFLPDGMTRGTVSTEPLGMKQDSPNAPIDLGNDTLLSQEQANQ